MFKKITNIKDCLKTFEGDGIPVTRAFPVPEMREIDPFLLFDHFGPINYQPHGATGVPAHPHCGFEAITYLLSGEIEHKDSWGGQASIKAGDIQWMTTGSGLVHSELVTENFKKNGGVMQGLQIWVNLPKKNKKVKPHYQHICKNDIPQLKINDTILLKILVGEAKEKKSLIQTYSPVSIFDVQFIKPGEVSLNIPKEQTTLLYVIEGEIYFNKKDETAIKGQMVFFDQNSNNLKFNSISNKGSYLVLSGERLNEPVSRYGPFIANTEGEIKQALLDFETGKMGRLD